MSKWRQLIYFIIFGFATGVLVESHLSFGFGISIFFLAVSFFIFVFWYFINREEKLFLFVFVFLISVSLGSFWTSARETALAGKVELPREQVSLERQINGVVIAEPDVREANTRLVVKTEIGRVLIFTDRYPEYVYGDILEIGGEIETPKNQSAFEVGEYFDWRAYLRKERISYTMFRPKITKIGEGGGSAIFSALYSFKQSFLGKIERVIPEPESSLAGGLILGAERSLGAKLLDDFRKTGVIHIVILSGYNLTIVANAILFILLLFLPRRAAFASAVVGVILFTIMTGAGPATVRAAIMSVIAVLARHSGRGFDVPLALSLAGFFMIIWNPLVLVFDVGFQLSFLATLGLVYMAPVFEERFRIALPEKFNKNKLSSFFISLVAATISAQLAVFPWILYKMGSLSIIAIPVNLIILGLIPVTMLLSFLAGSFGFLSIALATPFASLAYIFLAAEIKIVEFFADFSFSSVNFSHFSLVITLAIYSGYVSWLFRPNLSHILVKMRNL